MRAAAWLLHVLAVCDVAGKMTWRKKKRQREAAGAAPAVYRPPEMSPSLEHDGLIAADLANLAGRRDKRTRIPFWLVAGA